MSTLQNRIDRLENEHKNGGHSDPKKASLMYVINRLKKRVSVNTTKEEHKQHNMVVEEIEASLLQNPTITINVE